MTTQTDERDYTKSPSINFPGSHEEARLALIMSLRASLTDPTRVPRDLTKPFTTDAGLGFERTAEQAEWLNDARTAILSNVLFTLDEMSADIDLSLIQHGRGQA